MLSTPPHLTDVLIIGGGAAGLFAAATAGARRRRVVVLEHNERVGKKILISGGGRCNFTNLQARAENYLSANPDFCKSALARYQPTDFLQLVETHGIAYHEKKFGQQFCDSSSREIVDLLLRECAEAQVEIKTSCRIIAVRTGGSRRFVIETSQGDWHAESLIVATGGLSFANLGATDFGYRLARQFGLEVTPLHPGLVPLTFAQEERAAWAELSGVSLPVTVREPAHGIAFTENLLITHDGLSGPAILQISSYLTPPHVVPFHLLPELGQDVPAWLQAHRSSGKTLEQLLSAHWPQRFLKFWAQQQGAAARRPLAQLSTSEFAALTVALEAWPLRFVGTRGYAKAEVTRGGVATTELSSKTMEARKVQGLYFIGEVVDVTGWLGGYNFQWAWASGRAAGQVA